MFISLLNLAKQIVVKLKTSIEIHSCFFKVNRFLKKIEKDESFLDCAINLSAMMEERVRQNNAVEIYTDYFQVNFSKAHVPVF